MDTVVLHMQAGMKTLVFRTTVNQIFCPVDGSGWTIVDGVRFDWSRGDVVAILAWRPFEHHIKTEAILFMISDEQLLRKLNWIRTQDS